MRVLVTGGGGFLGRRLVELLVAEGHEVSFLARGRYPEVEATGARGFQADLGDAEAVRRAVDGHDAVHHVAAYVEPWGKLDDFRRVNVRGTENLIAAMLAAGVPRLIYTSTPSVASPGQRGVENGGQDLPYCAHHESFYGLTKAEAEQLVRASNGPGLATVALRPHLIFGPREDKMVPRLIDRARRGRLRVIGDGTNRVDLTYVDNAAWAQIDAQAALTGPDAPCAGKPYYVSNDEPVALWPWVNELLAGVGEAPLERRVSFGLALRVGGAMEWAWRAFGLSGEPPLTRQIVVGMGTPHWYDMGPAKRDLGYRVRVGMAEATAATVAWFREGRAAAAA